MGGLIYMNRMDMSRCYIELCPHSWHWRRFFGNSRSYLKEKLYEWMVCLISSKRHMKRQHDTYSVWPWPLTLPMSLTLDFRDEIFKINAFQESSQISLYVWLKNVIFHMLHEPVLSVQAVPLETQAFPPWCGVGGCGYKVSCGGHHRLRGKTTTGSALDPGVGVGVRGLPLEVGRGVPTKPKIWTHTDTKMVKKTSPLGYQTLKHAHMRPIEIPDTFP